MFNSTHYDSDYSFKGEISQVNMWDRELDDKDVRLLYLTCGWAPGNVLNWDQFATDFSSKVKKGNTGCPSIRGKEKRNG